MDSDGECGSEDPWGAFGALTGQVVLGVINDDFSGGNDVDNWLACIGQLGFTFF